MMYFSSSGGHVLLGGFDQLGKAQRLLMFLVLFVDVFLDRGANPPHGISRQAEAAFRVEPLGMMFAALASGLWLVNSVYSIGYMRGNREQKQTRFYVMFAVSLAAAMGIAGQTQSPKLMSFDMGGTSTDVALLNGRIPLTSHSRIGSWPLSIPTVDIHTIGAGGGSIAWLDVGGMLQVGPQSAGAAPGPACYGGGGQEPTVTDANLLLGRLQSDAFLGGEMVLDVVAARAALDRLAGPMGVSAVRAAQDIVAVANEHMAQALRAISIKRGADPREHVLVSFGGAGGLHVCALAALLDVQAAIVPVHGGVLSALGMLAARPGRQLSRTRIAPLDAAPEAELEAIVRRDQAGTVRFHPDLVDDLATGMSDDQPDRLDPLMTVARLRRLIEDDWSFALAIDFMDPRETAQFWYVSEAKLEPRLGNRHAEGEGGKEAGL